MSDYPTCPDTPTGSTFWDVAERLLSGLRWERRRVQGENRSRRREFPSNYQHLYVDIPLPNYPQYNNRNHYPIEAPEPTQDDPHFEFGWPAPPSPGLEPTPFDRVLMKGWGGRTEASRRTDQDQGQESLPEPDHDSEEEEDEPEVVRTDLHPPLPVYAPEESSDSESDSSESSGELRVMELDWKGELQNKPESLRKCQLVLELHKGPQGDDG
ncbi:hypothetical protein RhiLY_05229 [Ceratobasidium sp. AG-Ba]|nr:hypothetical protein RhiLY_05229 [Ceratobasidium sp. AG-Ba]